MPKEVTEIKEFLRKARNVNAKQITIKPNKREDEFKFKVRLGRYMYTFTVKDKYKATRLKQSLPPGLQVREVGKK